MKCSTYQFHIKTKILVDFQICISVPLSKSLQCLTFQKCYVVIGKMCRVKLSFIQDITLYLESLNGNT